jgi:3-deoxy-7-phosphoheptulonate synthase
VPAPRRNWGDGSPLKVATRPFGRILEEVQAFFDIHRTEGTYAGGVHLEMTGKNVTECTGGAVAIQDADLGNQYDTLCDPRLIRQALELRS